MSRRETVAQTVGYAVVVAGCSLALAFGDTPLPIIAGLLAAGFGVVVNRQTVALGGASTYRALFVGFTAGMIVSLATATAPFVYFLRAPVDYAAWLMGIRLGFWWMAVAALVVCGLFVDGLRLTFA